MKKKILFPLVFLLLFTGVPFVIVVVILFWVVSVGVCVSHRLRCLCWFSLISSTRSLALCSSTAAAAAAASTAVHRFPLLQIYFIYTYVHVPCISVHIPHFEPFMHAFLLYVAYSLSVDVSLWPYRPNSGVRCMYVSFICRFSFALLLFTASIQQIHEEPSVCIKYLCSRYDSVSLEWSADSDGCHLHHTQFNRWMFVIFTRNLRYVRFNSIRNIKSVSSNEICSNFFSVKTFFFCFVCRCYGEINRIKTKRYNFMTSKKVK